MASILSTSATFLQSKPQSTQFHMRNQMTIYNVMILKKDLNFMLCETLKIVQTTIAKQLCIDETTVASATKFVDLGADSLDTVEIMMALEEQFGVSIGESGAENISTVQDAADLIEKLSKHR